MFISGFEERGVWGLGYPVFHKILILPNCVEYDQGIRKESFDEKYSLSHFKDRDCLGVEYYFFNLV